jgi:uncharacterized protein YxjI
MKLLLKQKLFSLLDSFDVYGEDGKVAYKVKSELALGHKLKILNSEGEAVGEVKQKLIAVTPTFELHEKEKKIGTLKKKLFKLFGSAYSIDGLGWIAKGNFTEWNYKIEDSNGNLVATIGKQLLNLTDTYALDVVNPQHALYVLMFVIAIDAEKCSRDND